MFPLGNTGHVSVLRPMDCVQKEIDLCLIHVVDKEKESALSDLIFVSCLVGTHGFPATSGGG